MVWDSRQNYTYQLYCTIYTLAKLNMCTALDIYTVHLHSPPHFLYTSAHCVSRSAFGILPPPWVYIAIPLHCDSLRGSRRDAVNGVVRERNMP